MRINPLLHFSFSTIWNFILKNKIPYCSLYDEGYTYLGNKKNSRKNVMLKNGEEYFPAYQCEGAFENISRFEEEKGERIKQMGREEVKVFILTRNNHMINTNV